MKSSTPKLSVAMNENFKGNAGEWQEGTHLGDDRCLGTGGFGVEFMDALHGWPNSLDAVAPLP